jgi:hypothetical protein
MRIFWLNRKEDLSGVSGDGIVAEGVEFSDGVVALRWKEGYKSVAIFPNITELMRIHGHHGATVATFERPASQWPSIVTEGDLTNPARTEPKQPKRKR